MKLVLLTRDGVINVPRKCHVKSPDELEFLPGATARRVAPRCEGAANPGMTATDGGNA